MKALLLLLFPFAAHAAYVTEQDLDFMQKQVDQVKHIQEQLVMQTQQDVPRLYTNSDHISNLQVENTKQDNQISQVTGAVSNVQAQVANNAKAASDADAHTNQEVSSVRQKVDTNASEIATNSTGIATNSSEIATMQQWQRQADQNLASMTSSGRMDTVEQDIDQLKHDMDSVKNQTRRVGAMAMSASNLHYSGLDNSYALAVGEYAGKTSVAGGIQFNLNDNASATVQAAYDGQETGGSVGIHGNW